MSISFRIRRQYFDRMVNGTKKEEIRADTPFWSSRLFGPKPPKIAVFVCGKQTHRRWIKRIYREEASIVLGREPSPQGKKDLRYAPNEKSIIIELGEEYRETI